MTMLELDYKELISIAVELGLVATMSALLGFTAARSFYRRYRAIEVTTLQQEVLRLRRRVEGAESSTAQAERMNARTKRRNKSSGPLIDMTI